MKDIGRAPAAAARHPKSGLDDSIRKIFSFLSVFGAPQVVMFLVSFHRSWFLFTPKTQFFQIETGSTQSTHMRQSADFSKIRVFPGVSGQAGRKHRVGFACKTTGKTDLGMEFWTSGGAPCHTIWTNVRQFFATAC